MKNISLIFLFFFILINAFAQKEERDANYHFKQGNFPIAIKHYLELIDKDSNNIEYNYRLGISYLSCNSSPQKALRYLNRVNVLAATNYVGCFDMGLAKMYNQDFDGAIIEFEKCKTSSGNDKDIANESLVKISMCKNAKRYIAKPLDVSFVNLGKYINSPMDEYTPIISPDGRFLIYSSNQKYDSKFFYYYNNVYMSQLSGGIFKKGKTVSSVNTLEDEFVAGYSNNGERLYVQLQGYEGYEDLFYSNQKGSSFQGKKKLGENINSKGAEYAAYETVNGDTLFFSSNRPGGLGGMDLYYSLKLPTGIWSEPKNLGSTINSPYDEDFPILSPDGSKLYFCSNGTESMGGYDVFESKILGDRSFSEPKNIGYPLNDVFDNKTIAFSFNDRYAYVSSMRPDSYGFKDLYRVVFNQEDPSVKIFLLKLKLGTKDQSENLAAQDTSVKVVVYQRSKVVFGEYAYNSNNSEVAVALPPGAYEVDIVGDKIELKQIKLIVEDVPSQSKIEKKAVFVEFKK